MRLTRYDDENRYYRPCDYESDKQLTILKLCKKLGQLEDIEDELGLPLTTYFKLVYADYVYCYGYGNAIMKCNITNIDVRNKSISCWNGVCSMRKTFDGYGTWWALTKEEIEHGN